MGIFSSDTQMTRRTALSVLGSSALGVAGMSIPSLVAEEDELRKLLPNFTEQSRSILQRVMQQSGYSGQIPASDATAIAQHENVSVERLMVNLIPLAQS
jgi:hypothetical protein